MRVHCAPERAISRSACTVRAEARHPNPPSSPPQTGTHHGSRAANQRPQPLQHRYPYILRQVVVKMDVNSSWKQCQHNEYPPNKNPHDARPNTVGYAAARPAMSLSGGGSANPPALADQHPTKSYLSAVVLLSMVRPAACWRASAAWLTAPSRMWQTLSTTCKSGVSGSCCDAGGKRWPMGELMATS